jgi:hypothetical protein
MFILLCEFSIVSKFNGMNWNLVSRIFHIVFLSVDFGYIK